MGLDPTTIGIMATLAPAAAFGVVREMRRRRSARAALLRAAELGLDEPVSLHPVIDPSRCLGCGSCVEACPETDVLRIVEGRSRLVNAVHCIGHGRCKDACCNDAIELVFGTAKRGVQLPEVDGDYQSNVPGLYIAGELGGMGLIRNAMTQGMHAVANLSRDLRPRSDPQRVDVAIVGAGPAGLAAALACRARGLTHVVLEQDSLGGAVNHYPRRKLVMTAPVELPGVGKFHFREIGKEELLATWQRIVNKARLDVRAPWRVAELHRDGDGFRLAGDHGEVRARRVVLAIGRRGTPRKLGVPGEDSTKVAYRLLEPEPFAGLQALVVGGGNSAVEIAMALADAGAPTTLCHRGAALGRVAPENLTRLQEQRGPRLRVLLGTEVSHIEPQAVVLRTPEGERRILNDQVFVAVGGELPTQFLERIGVAMHWHHGTPRNGVALEKARRR